MANAEATIIEEVKVTRSVTLTLTGDEADTLQSLIGYHVAGDGEENKKLVDIWLALRAAGGVSYRLSVEGTSILTLKDKE